MDNNFVWCALIFAMAYILRDTVPSYRDLTDRYDRSRLDSINDAVDDNEQVMLGMGEELEKLQSDVAGHLTRLDDIEEALGRIELEGGFRPPPDEKP